MTLGCVWVKPRMPTQAAHQTSLSTPASFTSALPAFGAKSPVGERKNTQRKQTQLELNPQDFCSSRLEADSAPTWRLWSLSREEVPSHTLISLQLPHYHHTSYQGDGGQHTLRKDVTGILIESTSPTKWEGTRSTWGCSHRTQCLKNTIGNSFA